MLPKFGTCSTADKASGTITATFPDREDFVTGDLPVVFPAGILIPTLPKPGDEVFVLMFDRTSGVCFGVTSEHINIKGDRKIDGNLSITGTVTADGGMSASGGMESTGDITITGALNVGESITAGGNIKATGTVSGSNI